MKRLTKEEHSREQNKKYRTLIKNDRKRIIAALASKSSGDENFPELVQKAQSNLDKSVTKKIIHRNNAARRKSTLFRMLNSAK